MRSFKKGQLAFNGDSAVETESDTASQHLPVICSSFSALILIKYCPSVLKLIRAFIYVCSISKPIKLYSTLSDIKTSSLSLDNII